MNVTFTKVNIVEKLRVVIIIIQSFIENIKQTKDARYLEVGGWVGVRQPGRAGVFLELEGPVENLRHGTEVEGAHCGRSDAVPGC